MIQAAKAAMSAPAAPSRIAAMLVPASGVGAGGVSNVVGGIGAGEGRNSGQNLFEKLLQSARSLLS